MTAEQIKKIHWLNRVKMAERAIYDYVKAYENKQEKVHSMEKQYRAGIPSVKRNAIEAKIIDMLEAERQMNEKVDEAERITEEVYKAIHDIPDKRLALLLDTRYISFRTHEQTAEKLNVSIATEKRLHEKALDALKVDTL